MRELLVEIGCEELPAGSLRAAADGLRQGIERRLTEAGVAFVPGESHSTPRRLIVVVREVEERQPDQVKTLRGPSEAAAFGADGSPSKALEGFCRGQGVDPSEAFREGGHVWVKKTLVGVPTIELLQTVVPASLEDVPFAKTMRWADGTMRFARPIRWILASFGSDVVPFEVEGVRSALSSRGHRFRAPEEFKATTYAELAAGLRQRFVEPEFEERRRRIETQARALLGGTEPSCDLVEENANLTEWPEVLIGQFKPEYLELPVPVLQTVMAKHERFFPVAGEGGMTNQFVSVRNGGEEAAVRDGNAWVLNARFNDARFFYEEDKKRSLAEFLERTSAMTFQEKLGSVRQRADRLARLSREVALWSGADEEEAGSAYEAGLYAKADLSSGLVSELDELQGVIGGEYARREGFDDAVCWAIASHYDLSKNMAPSCAGARTAVRLLIADQLDKLAGFLGIGFVPTGSSDPYGLRRAVTQLIESAWTWPTVVWGYSHVFDAALDGYADQGIDLDRPQATASLEELFASRYEAILDGRHDLCDAATLPGSALLDPRGVRFRLGVLVRLDSDTAFVQTATRPANIVSAAVKKGIDVSPENLAADSLKSESGQTLLDAVQRQGPLASKSALAEDADGLVAALVPLADPINAFFDSTMVMVEETDVRDARLRLLAETDRVLRLAGDFTKIVVPG